LVVGYGVPPVHFEPGCKISSTTRLLLVEGGHAIAWRINELPSTHRQTTRLLCYSMGVCSVLLHLFLEEGGRRGSLLEHPFERGGLLSFPLKAWGETSKTSNIVPI